MTTYTIIFWIAVIALAWLGLRNLISIIIGQSQAGQLKTGQRLCHATSLVLYWGACVFAIVYSIWWPLAIGVILELIFRKSVMKSGEIVSREKIMNDIPDQNRYVAHFDMLGFKTAIDRNLDEAWGALRDLRASMDKILRMAIEDTITNQVIADRIRAYIFSDSILIFTLSDRSEDLKAILILSSHLFSESLASCVPLRGGISHGKFLFNIDLHLFCGKPFVQAYKIAERAQWAGIVVSDSVAKSYFDDPSRLMSQGCPILVKWEVPIKPTGKHEHWVVNWPHIFKNSFSKSIPITAEEFYRAFESLFGPYDDLREDARIKHENTVEFINWALL